MSKLVENYLLQQAVGKGVYGQVFRAIHQKTKEVFAVKVIPKSSFKSNPKLEQLAINEINILSSINHMNIVRFVETLKTPNNFYFVYEYCNEGTLESLLKKRRFFKESEALIYFKQLLDAFKELNKNSIMHRDLKPDNIFLSDGVVKLGDFGFCKMLEVNMAQTMLGSPIYMAPEILKEEIYTSKADIWSLGVVLFEMLFGYCPFQSSSISELINKLKDTQVSIPHEINRISEETEILLKKMLVKDQFKRIEWADLFDFVIDDKGKIVSGCKKQYAIENLEKYFMSDNEGVSTTNNHIISSSSNIPSAGNNNSNSASSSSNISSAGRNENEQKYSSFKEIESAEKPALSDQKQKMKPEEYHPFTTGFIPHLNEQFDQKYKPVDKYGYQQQIPMQTPEARMMKKPDLSDSDSLPVFEKLSLKHKSQSAQAQLISSKKKIEKQRFGDMHNRWLEAIKLVEDLALNSVDANTIQICIYILLKKLSDRLERESEFYPEWTDVLIEEKMGLKDAMDQIQKSNRDVSKMFEDEKENRSDEKQRKELMKIWENARNKFTLERAIRATFDKPSKDISVEQILI